METRYYLAVDIGASSGRHMLSHMESGEMIIEEIYRFPNGMIEKSGHKVWDVDRLFAEILTGMKKCLDIGKIPYSMGIDTWAVDFVLLDKNNKLLGDAVAYRDGRTKGTDKEVHKIVSEIELYTRTGIQKQQFNTIYQLMAIKMQMPEQFANAKSMLMIPDYFNFLLTGKKVQEYTNATTTQLVNSKTTDWDYRIIDKLEYPQELFLDIRKPGYELGNLSKEIQEKVGFNCKVILPPTHDTASAVMAIPTQEDDALYISSGTWSLMGTELKEADCGSSSMKYNLTNEGGYANRFRYLKNIMGLWMIQCVKQEIAQDMNFSEICKLAEKENIDSIVDVNDERFLAPADMTEEVKSACKERGQKVPQNIGEIAAVIYNSLAKCYAITAKEIEKLTGKKYSRIYIVGGGSNADYLNKLTAIETGKTVYAGPGEATAIGNIASQMIETGALRDLKDARRCIFESFEIKQYKPNQQVEGRK